MSKGEQIKLVLKKNFHLNLVESSQGGSKLVSTSIIQYSTVYHLAQSKISLNDKTGTDEIRTSILINLVESSQDGWDWFQQVRVQYTIVYHLAQSKKTFI